jgi:hypothetical protein
MSPYATGGGGVTFERKVAVKYLAHLLVADHARELGDGRRVTSVAFQQAPAHAVDDLVVRAACGDEPEASLVLAVGVRRAPDLVKSDESTQKLIRDFVRAVINTPADGPEHRFVLVVAGTQQHAEQLATLADLAEHQMNAPGFFDLVRTPKKFAADVRDRLVHVEGLVKKALIDLGVAEPDDALVQQRTWDLLSRLTVLMPRLETPDESDWESIVNSLVPVARGGDPAGASRLRDRLVTLASEYAPKAAAVDLNVVRRGAHATLDTAARRHAQGWNALDHLDQRALSWVRDTIAAGDGARSVRLARGDVAEALLAMAKTGTAVLAHGDSGVGKSALVLTAATSAAAADPDATQAICINLRDLPDKTVAFEAILGSPLATLLAELSAPRRLLVVDGADAVAEGMLEQLRYLIDGAHQAEVGLIAITSADNKQVVRDALAQRFGADVVDQLVPGLTNAQIDEVVETFPELANLAANSRSRELLRRPVVIDLLVRGGGLSGVLLSDADAMDQVWSGLVRRREQSDRGTPDARQIAMLRLANLLLTDGDPLEVVGALDPPALDGLRRDGLLRTSPDDPFAVGPDFAHDEIRRYAVARVLLTGDPATKLAAAGVPRWALGAARLACQALLTAGDSAANPVHRRFERLQAAYDALVDAGHGDRWGDVPGEALLTIGDPDPVLRDAWPELRADKGKGMQRLCRLVDQRLRDESGLVRILAVEPLINLLLEDDTPWRSGELVQDVLRDWLRALVAADTPAGDPLRIHLRDRLVAACDAADQRLADERAAAAAARAARTPEEIEEERLFMEKNRSLFTEIGYGGHRRRDRPQVPREITDEIVVELLALLGPDLGDGGEAILHRVGQDAPSWLAPAVEEVFTGRALAGYRRGFLAELTEAYYLDDEEDGSGFHEDGIRHHHARSVAVAPLAAWWRGPFIPLFQTDFRNAVAVLNRMLNHAALVRARTLASHGMYQRMVEDADLDEYRTDLDVTGTRRVYVGDSHVWIWYRGTGVGPYSCMSALQALERVCDQLVEIDTPIATIVAILLDGCENLAMVGLVVGLLVRHLEKADRLLDPYLAEPMVWHEEFGRVVSENGWLAAPSDGVVAPERRRWSLREAAMFLVVNADDVRAAELRAIGEQLVAKARRLIEVELEAAARRDEPIDDAVVEQELVTVRAWASGLDSDTYQAESTEGGLIIQSTPPDEIVQAMAPGNEEVERSQAATRLMVRYYIEPKKGEPDIVTAEDLAADVRAARELLEHPPVISVSDPWDVPAAVAAAALEARLLRGVVLPDDLLMFAVDTILRVAEGKGAPRRFEFEETYFEQAADRSAARVLPLLLLPEASALLALVDVANGTATYGRVIAGGAHLARAVAHEVRLHLARGLDRVWQAPCGDGSCHHELALELAIESMRDSAFGDWDPETSHRRVVVLDDPVDQTLAGTADDAVYFSRLDAAIRALAPASMADICISPRANEVLAVVLAAHRRSLLAYEHDMDSRGTHALVAARALLTIAVDGDDAPIFDHIDAYADNTTLLGTLIRALSGAAEEHPDRAATARRLWPEVIAHVIALHESGHTPFDGRHRGDYTLASLLPNAAGEVTYLYRELEGDPIVWWDPLAWQSAVERWLPVAEGHPTCVDHIVAFVGALAPADQVRLALSWVSALVLPDASRIANRTFLLTTWLIDIRSAAVDADALAQWQRIVDALVVAGVTRLAPYSE